MRRGISVPWDAEEAAEIAKAEAEAKASAEECYRAHQAFLAQVTWLFKNGNTVQTVQNMFPPKHKGEIGRLAGKLRGDGMKIPTK